jgi:CubicO group peptidase (beta-lactamase class C family)
MSRWALLLSLALVCWAGRALAEAAPVFSDGGPNAAEYGQAEHYPIDFRGGANGQRNIVGNYSHFDELRASRRIAAAPAPSALSRAAQELDLAYEFRGQTSTISQYLDHVPVTGLLVMQDRTILFEHYQYARTDRDRFTSQSMAKTLVGLLVGLALRDGKIRSLDDRVSTYLPELAPREIGRVPLHALLQMSSGIEFHEVYNGHDDISRLSRALTQPGGGGALEAVQLFNTRLNPPGQRFDYAGLDTEVLGLVLQRVTGKSLAELVKTQIWDPIGAESDASWLVDSHGDEIAYCCFNAVLRDWARLAAMLAQDGMWDGRQVIPKDWIQAATTDAAPGQSPGANGRRLGYGFQVWLLPGDRGQFALIGIYGQTILIDPQRHVVLVQTAVLPKATDPPSRQELLALWQALVAKIDAQ